MTAKDLPGKALQPIKHRKEHFRDVLAFVADRGGWITSVAGAAEVTMEFLPGSDLPAELAAAGYCNQEIGEGERILSHAVSEAVITQGSSRSVMVTHGGITRVIRYSFPLD
jgi:hypothetical protein